MSAPSSRLKMCLFRSLPLHVKYCHLQDATTKCHPSRAVAYSPRSIPALQLSAAALGSFVLSVVNAIPPFVVHLTLNERRFSTKNDNMKLVWESVLLAPVLILLPVVVQGEGLTVCLQMYGIDCKTFSSRKRKPNFWIALKRSDFLSIYYIASPSERGSHGLENSTQRLTCCGRCFPRGVRHGTLSLSHMLPQPHNGIDV